MQKIISAILTADPEELKKQLLALKDKSNWVHIDIIDGVFAPNISVNLFELGEASHYFNLEIHLLVQDPEKYFDDCDAIGAKRVIIHQEATQNLQKVLERAGSHKFNTAVALNPQTQLAVLWPLKEKIQSLLIMSVNPGFQGQEFVASSIEKVREARTLFPEMLIGIDGGISKENIKEVFNAGISYAVVGSNIVKAEHPAEALRELEEMIE